MNRVYIVADRELDRGFGFKLELAQTLLRAGMSAQEGYIRDRINDTFYEEHLVPRVGEVFVVHRTEGNGLVGRVNVHTSKKLFSDDVSPQQNPKIRLKETYLEELRKYLAEESADDRIVVAPSQVAHKVKEDVERLIVELYLKVAIPKPTSR